MSLHIITDSTCDLPADELARLGIRKVPLTVNFQGQDWLDWEEITPGDIIRGVEGGADLPTTSQPSPEAFAAAYREAVGAGATEILVVTLSSHLSGTFQSASLAAADAGVPVEVFDSQAASIGIAHLLWRAAELRDAGHGLEELLPSLESIRRTLVPFFSVAGLDFLQKGGRLGRAAAVIGNLLNLKPILSVHEGKITAEGRARGMKRAIAELVSLAEAHIAEQPGRPYIDFLHVQDPAAADQVKEAVDAAGIDYEGGGIYEIGAVIASHTGPGTCGLYLHIREG